MVLSQLLHVSSFSWPVHRFIVPAKACSTPHKSRRQVLTQGVAVTALSLVISLQTALAAAEPLSEPERLHSPVDPAVSVLDFCSYPDDPNHGYPRTRQISLEMKDGASSSLQGSVSSLEEEHFINSLDSIGFKGKEDRIVGKSAVSSHTSDGGDTLELIPLRSQVPGEMLHRGSNVINSRKMDRPRFFDAKAQSMCWGKAETVPGRHPDRWRKDAVGNIIFKRFHTCQGCLCFEYDHIIPYSKGGPSVVDNCQLLQTRVNRLKSDKLGLFTNELKGHSCDVTFSDSQLDIIEISFYGNILRPGKECRVRTIDERRGTHKSEQMAACMLP